MVNRIPSLPEAVEATTNGKRLPGYSPSRRALESAVYCWCEGGDTEPLALCHENRNIFAPKEQRFLAAVFPLVDAEKEIGDVCAALLEEHATFLEALVENALATNSEGFQRQLDKAKQRHLHARFNDEAEKAVAELGSGAIDVGAAIGRLEALRDETAKAHKSRLLTIPDLFRGDDPRWLVDELFQEGSVACLYGKSGCGKTFLALDVALSIATGRRWCGHDVLRGSVVYMPAEGFAGLKKRVAAWFNEREADVDEARGFRVWDQGGLVNFSDRSCVASTIHELKELPDLRLVVVDTLSQHLTAFGGDENGSDMGTFLRGVQDLIAATGCSVLLLHHTGKQESAGPRGSTQLWGAADTLLELKAAGRQGETKVLQLDCVKQKDAEEFGSKFLGLHPRPAWKSCILLSHWGCETTPTPSATLVSLVSCSLTDRGLTAAEWLAVCKDVSRATFYRHLKSLMENGFVDYAATCKNRYVPTEKGRLSVGESH